MYDALVLDMTGRPVGTAEPEKSLSLVRRGHFVISYWEKTFKFAGGEIRLPKVISLKCYVPIPKYATRKVTAPILFARDGYSCQYCHKHKFGLCGNDEGCEHCLPKGMKLTKDHVKPRSKFKNAQESNTWENMVTACPTCNHAKGDKLLTPTAPPARPTGIIVTLYEKVHDPEQREFIKPFLKNAIRCT